MGLDMYLSKRKNLSRYNPASNAQRIAVNAIFGISEVQGLQDDVGETELTFPAAYWRKANMIHRWFVDNCQDGVDECQESLVQPKQLKELYALCKKVLKTKDTSLLPPQGGFFFGSIEIDEWYWQDIKDTIKILKTELAFIAEAEKNGESWDYYYQASW